MGFKDKEKQKAYQNQWLQRRRKEWVRANGPCRECGSSESLTVARFGPAPKTSNIWSLEPMKREAALKNCGVLCGVCFQNRRRREVRERLPVVVDEKGRLFWQAPCPQP